VRYSWSTGLVNWNGHLLALVRSALRSAELGDASAQKTAYAVPYYGILEHVNANPSTFNHHRNCVSESVPLPVARPIRNHPNLVWQDENELFVFLPSALILRFFIQTSSALSRKWGIRSLRIAMSQPSIDSSVTTNVPPSCGLNIQMCLTREPRARPIQPMRFWGTTSWSLDVIGKPPETHVKTEPLVSVPSSCDLLISGCHSCQALIFVWIFHTTSGEAWMKISL